MKLPVDRSPPGRVSPLNPNGGSLPQRPSPPAQPTPHKQEEPKDDDDNRGNLLKAAVIAAMLALGGLAIGSFGPANASPPIPATAPSAYCNRLADQFDGSLDLPRASPYLASAKANRISGWVDCTEGRSAKGEFTLKTAVRELGVRPVSRYD